MFDPNKTHVTIHNNVKIGIRIQLENEWWLYNYKNKSFIRTQKASKYHTMRVTHYENLQDVKNKMDKETVEHLYAGMVHALYKQQKAA